SRVFRAKWKHSPVNVSKRSVGYARKRPHGCKPRSCKSEFQSERVGINGFPASMEDRLYATMERIGAIPVVAQPDDHGCLRRQQHPSFAEWIEAKHPEPDSPPRDEHYALS